MYISVPVLPLIAVTYVLISKCLGKYGLVHNGGKEPHIQCSYITGPR